MENTENDIYSYENEIEQEINSLTKLSLDMQATKEKVLSKLVTSLDNMVLDLNNEPAKMIEAKGSILNTFTALTADIEKQRRATIKFKAKQQLEQEMQNDVSELVVSILNKITNEDKEIKEQVDETIETVDKSVEDRIKDENIKILDDEIKLENEKLKTSEVLDKYNLSKKGE